MLLECYDERGNPLNKYPVGSVECTLEDPDTLDHKHTMKLDYASDSCQLSGSGSDAGYWVFVRGNWICKCPLGLNQLYMPCQIVGVLVAR